jgi:hypothetical protein
MAGPRWVAERRVLRRASHQSLKVPVFRDQSFAELSQTTPATSYARGDWDAQYRRDDGEADADTGPLATVREVPPTEPASMEDVSWDEASRRPLPSNGLTFKPALRPWYGSSRVLLFALGIAVIAMIVAAVLLVRANSSDGTEDSTTVTQTATTSAVPPSAPASNPVGADPLPPAELPPPPPPPPEETTTAPQGTGGGYRWYPPSQSDAPTGRPREPAPISVAPQPHEAPEPGHSAPGDAPHRRRGFFG